LLDGDLNPDKSGHAEEGGDDRERTLLEDELLVHRLNIVLGRHRYRRCLLLRRRQRRNAPLLLYHFLHLSLLLLRLLRLLHSHLLLHIQPSGGRVLHSTRTSAVLGGRVDWDNLPNTGAANGELLREDKEVLNGLGTGVRALLALL
jgi:hypothetical protein